MSFVFLLQKFYTKMSNVIGEQPQLQEILNRLTLAFVVSLLIKEKPLVEGYRAIITL